MPPKKKRPSSKYAEDDFVDGSDSGPDTKRKKSDKPKTSTAQKKAGEKSTDEEGNTYWEVSFGPCCELHYTNLTSLVGRSSSPRHPQFVQREDAGEYPRALREGWESSARKEGINTHPLFVSQILTNVRQGISLSMDQFNALMGILPQMIESLESQQIEVVHPAVKPAKEAPEKEASEEEAAEAKQASDEDNKPEPSEVESEDE